ncbi:unnamed protein product [Diamesa serratosioi]
MFDEEESKKARIFQREKRQELQLIIERCNENGFDYVCVPRTRNVDKDFCFGSNRSRKIHIIAADKEMNSFMRRVSKEFFSEPVCFLEEKKSEEDVETKKIIDLKLTGPFASRVPRFQDVPDVSGAYRRNKKVTTSQPTVRKIGSAFGSSTKRLCLLAKVPTFNLYTPGAGTYNIMKPKQNFYNHSFGGVIRLKSAYQIICNPINMYNKCHSCGNEPKNIFWKRIKSTEMMDSVDVLCRACFKAEQNDIKLKSKSVLEKNKKIKNINDEYEKTRYCDFYHHHNRTTAAVRILTPKQLTFQLHRENYLNTFFYY